MVDIEKLTGYGAPSVLLPGAKGQIYEDLDTGRLYECKGERGFIRVDGDDQDNQFNWVLKGVDISYNDLQDKPFSAPKVYEFDGNTGGLDSFNYNNVNYYKVSDDILTVEQLVGGTFTVLFGGTESKTFDIPSDISEDSGCIILEFVIVVFNYQELSAVVGLTIPSNGIYFAKTDNFFGTKITTHAKTIDKACLPAIEVDDLPSIPFSKIKECLVVTFNVSLGVLVDDSQPTLNVSYDGYTLDELITSTQSGHVIFELSDGFRLFPVKVNNHDDLLSIELFVTYLKGLYAIRLVCNKADGRFVRNDMLVFTAR